MASTNTKSSRFSTLKIFNFTSSKPPRPPPKDAHYLYAASSRNPSVVSFSNQSTLSPDSDPQHAAYKSTACSLRCPSPSPSRILQPTPHPQCHSEQIHSQQSPPPSIFNSSRSVDPVSASSKKSFLRKVSSFRKRSASKSSRVTSVEDATDDESISLPWNVQHHIHIDEAFQGVPPEWSSTLAELGYSEAEIALIQKGRRNRSPMPEPPPSTTPSRSQSPTSTTVNPRARSSSLRRQKSDASIARSERSLRIGPPAPPPPLPLPPPPLTPALSPNSAAPAAPPPTPASGGAFGDATNKEDDSAPPSEAQYAYLNPHYQPTPIQSVPVPALAPVPAVPVAQPTPVHVLQRTPSNSRARSLIPPSRPGSSDRERRTRAQTPPRRPFRVVNTTPPPDDGSSQTVYLEDTSRRSPMPLTPVSADWPLPEANGDTVSLRRPSVSETPPLVPPRPTGGFRHVPPKQSMGDAGPVSTEEDEVVFNGSSSRKPRPSVLSILPPRLSLRKDTLSDLSSWSASLFSSIPSSSQDGSPSTTHNSPASTRTCPAETSSRRPSKPSVTLPSIVLHSEVREQDGEGENAEHDDEGHEHEYSFSASPLYHELMGMMQERSAAANGISSPASGGSPASTNFQLDSVRPVSPDGHHHSNRPDSQLTIRLDPRRDSSRDSSASASTIVHATIVRGASIVRRVRADVIPAPASAATTPRGKEHERAQVQAVQEDDEESDSSSDDEEEEGDFSGSPSGTLALTSGPSSQEGGDGGNKSPRLAHLRDPLYASPSPSPLRASFLESEHEPVASTSTENPAPPPPPPPFAPRRPPIAISTTNLESQDPIVSSSSSSLPATAASGDAPPSDDDDDDASTTSQNPRYPAWLAAIVLPLVEFIDDAADPRAIFTDLQEIAQGESGSVYAAHAVPAIAQQFRPMTPRSPARRLSQECKRFEKDSEGGAVAQVAIKRVLIPRGGSSKLVDLRHELELARRLRHANVLRMERLYVDVVEESLWVGMELMDRSLADVLAVVGEDAGDGYGPVAVSEKMIARFVWDVLMALSYIRKHHIAHRDVRTDNLLLSRAGVLKLSDFSNAVCSPPGSPKRSDPVGVVYWQAPEMRTGPYDPLKVDVWSLGATTWELAHGDPPFSDVQDTRLIVGHELPPVREPETLSRSFHDFLHLCSQPVGSRPDPDELLNAYFIRTACPRSEIVRLLGQCKAIDEEQLLRQNDDFDS